MKFSEILLRAMQNGANEEVKLMLEQSDHSDLHLLFDFIGYTLLHYAVTFNNVEITQYLLDKGCQVDTQTRDKPGYTPLMLVVKADDERDDAVMQTLLEAGADIEFVNNNNHTVLEIAFNSHPSFEILQTTFRELRNKYTESDKLAQKLIDVGCPLPYAVFVRDAKIIEYMLDRNIAVDSLDPADDVTSLHLAVGLAETEIVQVLLKYGADIESLDVIGASPLLYLCESTAGRENEQLAILKALLQRNVSITTCNPNSGLSQTFSALIRGSCEIVRTLLHATVDFTAKDGIGNTVLHYIAENNKPGIVDELKPFMEKLDVNAPDNYGHSSLYWAIQKGNVEMVKFLLDHGAQVNDCLFDVYYSSDANLKCQHDECAELLVQYNARPQDLALHQGRELTIFDVAIEYENIERINPALGQLAIIEKQGVTITELIRSKIESHLAFKEYFEKCRGILDKNISGTVTVFKLLTANKRQWSKYLKNQDLAMAFMCIMYKSKVKSHHRYYYNILKKHYSAASVYKALKVKAAGIIYKLLDDQLADNILIVDKIIDYLDEQDLRQLHKIFEDVL